MNAVFKILAVIDQPIAEAFSDNAVNSAGGTLDILLTLAFTDSSYFSVNMDTARSTLFTQGYFP
jgi:hypothetical protein